MTSADLLEIDHAAEAFGVSRETLLQRLDGGGLPEAVKQDGGWTVPTEALNAIAEREGWALDLTSSSPPRKLAARPEKLDHYVNESMAAHAAVVLAKTQATAARAEARDLARQLTHLTSELEAETEARRQAAEALSTAEKAQAVLERDRAVADGRADELRSQIEQERVERSLLASRIGTLEADREEAIASLGWWSRRRYDRSRNRSKGAAKPAWSQRAQETGHYSRLGEV
ncbi:MAG: hypothetical protein GY773_29170 [Actinomycetia bacterium]|nr:hypothetical protein [Actinomycetes bacterium]